MYSPVTAAKGKQKTYYSTRVHDTQRHSGAKSTYSYQVTWSLTTPLWHDVVTKPAPCLNIVSVPAQADGLIRPAFLTIW